MAKYRVTKVFAPEGTWSFTNDKGEEVVLKSYYLDLEGTPRKYVVNRKPESDPIKEGETYDLKLSEETNKSGKYYKAKIQSFPDLVCKKCGHTGPLDEFRPEPRPDSGFQKVGGKATSQAPEGSPDTSEGKTSQNEAQAPSRASQDEPPIELRDINF